MSSFVLLGASLASMPSGYGCGTGLEARALPPRIERPAQTAIGAPVPVDLDGDGLAETLTLVHDDTANQAVSQEVEIRRRPELGPSLGSCSDCTLEVRSTTIASRVRVSGSIELVALDPRSGRRELLITRRAAMDEDPPYVYRVVWFSGGAAHEQELWHSSGYSSGVARLDGGGRITLHYDDCFEETWVTYRLGARMIEEGRRVVPHPDAECAACPHVYVIDPVTHGEQFRGEILRNLHRRELGGVQELTLGAVSGLGAGGVMIIELREEEDETTFLDAVHLEVNGARVAPRDCVGGHCAADGSYTRLVQGQHLRLEFDVGALSGDARLIAEGYYVPR